MPDGLYLREASGQVILGNDLIELGFDASSRGALVSIVDKRSGYQFVRDSEAPKSLFRLALRREADRELEWLEANDAQGLQWTREEADETLTLALTVGPFPNRPVRVTVRVTLEKESPLSRWRLTVTGLEEAAVYQLTCPLVSGVLKVGEGVPGEAVAVPRHGEGYVFHDPYPVVDGLPLCAGEGPESPWVGWGETSGVYPGGWALQLMLYYNDRAGLYLACHDAGQNVKGFHVGPLPEWGPCPVLDISHYPTEAMSRNVEFLYDIVLGVFQGQWWEGADLYKTWARRQWWCEKKLWDRDIPEWLRRGVGVFQMQNYDIPVLNHTHSLGEIADLVNRLSEEAGVPLLALIFNFEARGGWSGPIGFFPPREGEAPFRAAMDKLRAAGNYGFVYIPGGNWYIALPSYDPPFDSWAEFEREGRALALVDAQGNPRTGKMYDWDAAVLCPAAPGTREWVTSLLVGCVERGCPVVQIDNFPVQNARECYSPDHGHPPGYGAWWAEQWTRILQDTRERARALDPNVAITTEGISEGFIPWLDLFDQRAGNMEYFGHYSATDPAGGESIPLFSYVYGGYIGAYCAAYPECSRPEVLYWARCFGKSLVQGVIPTGGWYLADTPGLNPVTTQFWKKVTRAAAREGWKYIMFGEMLKPPPIEVPVIDFSYVRLLDLIGFTRDYPQRHPERRHVVRDYAVQRGSFRALDGTIGHIFVNVSQEAQQFEVSLPAYDSTEEMWNLDAVVDGERRALRQRIRLPITEQVHMEPLSVLLIEVSPAAE